MPATAPSAMSCVGFIASLTSRQNESHSQRGPRGAFYGRFRHAIPTHIRPQVRDLALRGLVALMVAVEFTTRLWWRRPDDDHQNEDGGINHGDLLSLRHSLCGYRSGDFATFVLADALSQLSRVRQLILDALD